MPTPRRARRPWLRELLCLLLLLCAAPAGAKDVDHGNFGFGAMAGDPNGLNLKIRFTDAYAMDVGLGFSFLNGEHIQLHTDFLWEHDITGGVTGELELYVGIGPKIGFFEVDDEGARFGWRLPLGGAVMLVDAPLDIFLELAPGMWLNDPVEFDFDVVLGFRFWF